MQTTSAQLVTFIVLSCLLMVQVSAVGLSRKPGKNQCAARNEVHTKCGALCELSCKDFVTSSENPECEAGRAKHCQEGCVCKSGTARNKMGICVTKNVCVAELLEDGYFNGHEGKQSGNYNIDDEKTVSVLECGIKEPGKCKKHKALILDSGESQEKEDSDWSFNKDSEDITNEKTAPKKKKKPSLKIKAEEFSYEWSSHESAGSEAEEDSDGKSQVTEDQIDEIFSKYGKSKNMRKQFFKALEKPTYRIVL